MSKNDNWPKIDIISGKVDLQTLTMKTNGNDDALTEIKRAPDDYKRVRPNGKVRHDPLFYNLRGKRSVENFLHPTTLEWMSINWRKYRASLVSPSLRRMILNMFEEDY